MVCHCFKLPTKTFFFFLTLRGCCVWQQFVSLLCFPRWDEIRLAEYYKLGFSYSKYLPLRRQRVSTHEAKMQSWKKSTQTTLSCRTCLSLRRLVTLCWSRLVSSCVCCSETDNCCCRDNLSELHFPIWTKRWGKKTQFLSFSWLILPCRKKKKKKVVQCHRVPH